MRDHTGDYTLVIGNKNYSSWSLRGWLAMKQSGAPFQELRIPLRRAETRSLIQAHSPTGLVPALKGPEITLGDSLAIGEYLAERFPEAGLWPGDPLARAQARAAAAEMHSGFAALRRSMPMDIRGRHPGRGWGPEVAEDVGRILALWRACRQRFGSGGDFLFGAFSLADAFYAPVVSRFITYQVACDDVGDAYCNAVMNWPAMQEWCAAAEAETEVISFE